MAETAAHLVDHVLPQVPVRQWVLSLPKRLRYFLHHRAELVNPVLRIFLAEVEAALRAFSSDATDGARFEAVTFVHRFGSALNANLHFHCCVIDGLFREADEGVGFHPALLTDRALAKVQQQTRRRVLQWFQRRALLPVEATALMLGWDHVGSSPSTLRSGSRPGIAPGWNGCSVTAPGGSSPASTSPESSPTCVGSTTFPGPDRTDRWLSR
jgi:hypothetical protein